jgi:hypothetical protein
VTGAALRMTWHHFFVAGAACHTWNGKIAKRIGTSCSPLSIFEGSFQQLLRFLMPSMSKTEEVSQNCFVFDVVKLKSCGSLAGLLRF